MHTIMREPASPAELAQAVVKLIDSKGYNVAVALLTASCNYEGVSWDFFQKQVRPLVEKLRPDKHHSNKHLTHAAATHAAIEEKDRQADQGS